jgi:RNA polymerase sigma-70 factor, ECF subfamily
MRSAAAEDVERSAPEPRPKEFSDFVRDHLDFVWRLLRRFGFSAEDADDSTQQVFMIAARKFETLDPEHERAFLYATARRVAANARRGTRRRREVSEHDPREWALQPGPGPEARTELSRASELLDELLAQMPAELARVLVLAEVEQMTAHTLFRELLEAARHKNPFSPEDA